MLIMKRSTLPEIDSYGLGLDYCSVNNDMQHIQ